MKPYFIVYPRVEGKEQSYFIIYRKARSKKMGQCTIEATSPESALERLAVQLSGDNSPRYPLPRITYAKVYVSQEAFQKGKHELYGYNSRFMGKGSYGVWKTSPFTLGEMYDSLKKIELSPKKQQELRELTEKPHQEFRKMRETNSTQDFFRQRN